MEEVEPTREASADDGIFGASAFQHKPLDRTKASIRLLRILPDLSSSSLTECEIWHADTNAEYDCLSYVWGPEGDDYGMLVNGKDYRIRENLWEFLNVARTKYRNLPRTFWIDALCIDQESTLERNHQVAQMGAIYSKAQEVIVWLGYSLASVGPLHSVKIYQHKT
jgi:hypothetical protein